MELTIILALASFVALVVSWLLLPGSARVERRVEAGSMTFAESSQTSAGA